MRLQDGPSLDLLGVWLLKKNAPGLFVMAGPVPAIPMLWSAAPQAIGITGTRPVMTGEDCRSLMSQPLRMGEP
jgi:hypothetical protein